MGPNYRYVFCLGLYVFPFDVISRLRSVIGSLLRYLLYCFESLGLEVSNIGLPLNK